MGIGQNDLELYQRNFDEVIKKYEQLKREAEAAAAAGKAWEQAIYICILYAEKGNTASLSEENIRESC